MRQVEAASNGLQFVPKGRLRQLPRLPGLPDSGLWQPVIVDHQGNCDFAEDILFRGLPVTNSAASRALPALAEQPCGERPALRIEVRRVHECLFGLALDQNEALSFLPGLLACRTPAGFSRRGCNLPAAQFFRLDVRLTVYPVLKMRLGADRRSCACGPVPVWRRWLARAALGSDPMLPLDRFGRRYRRRGVSRTARCDRHQVHFSPACRRLRLSHIAGFFHRRPRRDRRCPSHSLQNVGPPLAVRRSGACFPKARKLDFPAPSGWRGRAVPPVPGCFQACS